MLYYTGIIMLVIIILHVYLTIQSGLGDTEDYQWTYDQHVAPYKLKNDCTTHKEYCFKDEDCFNKCSLFYKTEFACFKGVCEISQSKKLLNNCNLEKGIAAYLISVPELKFVDWLCKPIDMGIVEYKNDPNTHKKEYVNVMCEGGTLSANYVDRFPQQHDCRCPDSMIYAVVPATELKRQHVQCVKEDHRWIYQTNKLVYDPHN